MMRLSNFFWMHFIPVCLAGRRDPNFASFGKLDLSTDRLPLFWRSQQRFASDGNYHHQIRPAALKLKKRREKRDKEASSSSSSSSSSPSTVTVTNAKEHALQLSQPLIPQEAWDTTTGTEFEDTDAVEVLTQSGLHLCVSDGDENVKWKPHPSTVKLLEEHGDKMTALEDGNVLVYIGKIQKEGAVASNLPMIKTESILPLSSEDMAELLMDSSRVQIYNKMSLGRKDVHVWKQNTKIVRNLTKPPVAKSKMVSVTFMHSRPLGEQDHLENSDGYIVVSRAVPGKVEEDLADLPRNDILMGANLLQNIGPDRCFMTAVTHVYSPALPTMLARSMGVTSAVNFVRDIRESCQPHNSN